MADVEIVKNSKMIKIDWSGRSHNFSKKEIHYLSNVIRNADPLT